MMLLAAALLGLTCAPAGLERGALEELASNDFVIEDSSLREQFALDLTTCADARDPFFRDDIGYGAMATLLRRGDVSPELVRVLSAELSAILRRNRDRTGFAKPFAALYLAEVARHDAQRGSLTPEQRELLLETATTYMLTIRDYRGFDDRRGWRHGVAHGADLLMQLARNEQLTDIQRQTIRAAVLTQVAPERHFYIYGEPGRLTRPFIFSILRGGWSEEEQKAALKQLADPAPLADWGEAFKSRSGLARLHNTRAFLSELVIRLEDTDSDDLAALRVEALKVLQELP